MSDKILEITNIIKNLDAKNVDVVYQFLIKLQYKNIEEVEPLSDEIEALKEAKEEIKQGLVEDFYSIDWDI